MLQVVLALLLALLITLVVEIGLAYILGVRGTYNLVGILIINVITNTLLNGIMLPIEYLLSGYTVAIYSILAVLEILVVISEFLYYKIDLEYKKIHPLLLSFILNAASFSIGLIVFSLIY